MTFPHAIPGFPDSTRYVLLDHRPDSMFRWLQSLDQGELAFVVIDPLLTDADYPLASVQNLLRQLEICGDEEVLVLAICTVPPPPASATVNLLAPVGIGLQSRHGAQVILHDGGYSAQSQLQPLQSAA